MHTTWLIIKREYLTRVRKRSFIIITLLVPVIFIAFIALQIYISTGGSTHKQMIAVIDDSGLFVNRLENGNNIFFSFLDNHKDEQVYQKQYAQEGYTGLLYIPPVSLDDPKGFRYYGTSKLGIETYGYLTGQLSRVIKDRLMMRAGIDKSKLDTINSTQVAIDQPSTGTSAGNAEVATIAGIICGFLIYFILIFFGMAVMRGVMEEKTSRIAEVIISSVKPFQLMLGKITGIAAVGLTQFLIWIILGLVLFTGLSTMAPGLAQHAQQLQAAQQGNNAAFAYAMQHINDSVSSIPIAEMLIFFLIYFLGGYLLYAALFAAVGSVVDHEASDVQSLTLPITMPIIISFFIMFRVVREPDSTLAVIASIFPLSSPLVMVARIPFNVPWWQLALSVGLLIMTFLFTTWMAGKIYRTGILLYGKKVTLKEMGKWIFRKN